jgi:hypothetical protein
VFWQTTSHPLAGTPRSAFATEPNGTILALTQVIEKNDDACRIRRRRFD